MNYLRLSPAYISGNGPVPQLLWAIDLDPWGLLVHTLVELLPALRLEKPPTMLVPNAYFYAVQVDQLGDDDQSHIDVRKAAAAVRLGGRLESTPEWLHKMAKARYKNEYLSGIRHDFRLYWDAFNRAFYVSLIGQNPSLICSEVFLHSVSHNFQKLGASYARP